MTQPTLQECLEWLKQVRDPFNTSIDRAEMVKAIRAQLEAGKQCAEDYHAQTIQQVLKIMVAYDPPPEPRSDYQEGRLAGWVECLEHYRALIRIQKPPEFISRATATGLIEVTP